jgi:deoxyribodipyrimidine photolyase-related protein
MSENRTLRLLMGDHCRGCHYDPKQRVGDRACPFNSLYWHFHHRHRALLEKNPRIGMVYRTLDRMEAAELKTTLHEAEQYLNTIATL